MRTFLKPIIFFFSALLIASCGPVEFIQGTEDISYLKGEDKVAFEIKYTDTKVGDEDEDKFKKEKIEEKNEDEAGEGDDWAEKWENDKENVFNPRFKTQFNDYFLDSDADVSLANDEEEAKNANYKITVHVKRMEPGFYGGVVHKSAELDTRMEIVKKGNEGSPVTVLKAFEVPSIDEHLTTKERLESAYKVSAMHYGRWFREKLSK